MKDSRQEFVPLDFEVGAREAEAEPEPQERSGLRGTLIEVFETLVLALVLFLAINTVSARIQVDGRSMEPSFHDGDYVIVNKLAYRFGDFERGDVIVFPFPHNPEEDYIKRVIALPGERVEVQEGRVFVDGQRLNEPYILEPSASEFQPTVIPDGTVFVMGDNRNDSSDSRTWGPLPIDSVIGKAVFVYWPVADLGVVEHPDNLLASP